MGMEYGMSRNVFVHMHENRVREHKIHEHDNHKRGEYFTPFAFHVAKLVKKLSPYNIFISRHCFEVV